MPFLMTHLYVAKDIYNLKHMPIYNLSQFYLGIASPDAIHNRLNYISEYKKASHLCVGDEPWGMLSNNDDWIRNVLSFLNQHKHSDDLDFLLGYCVHILTDIYNNITVWTPFKQRYQGELWKKYGELYHLECGKVDIALALNPQNSEDFWLHIQNAKAFDFFNLLSSEEIEKQKENILYSCYVNKRLCDTSSNEVVSVNSTKKFIEKATNFVISKLHDFEL